MNAWQWLAGVAAPWFVVAVICLVMLGVLAALASLVWSLVRGIRTAPRPDRVTRIIGK